MPSAYSSLGGSWERVGGFTSIALMGDPGKRRVGWKYTLGPCLGLPPALQQYDSEQRRVVATLPRGKILLESDASHFRPRWVPQGQHGHPKYLAEVAQEIARIREGVTVEGVLQEGARNAREFFRV